MISAFATTAVAAIPVGPVGTGPNCTTLDPIVGTWSCLTNRNPGQGAPTIITFFCDGRYRAFAASRVAVFTPRPTGVAALLATIATPPPPSNQNIITNAINNLITSVNKLSTSNNATPLQFKVGFRSSQDGFWKVDPSIANQYITGGMELMYDGNANFNGQFTVVTKYIINAALNGLRANASAQFFNITGIDTNPQQTTNLSNGLIPGQGVFPQSCDPMDNNTTFAGNYPLGRIQEQVPFLNSQTVVDTITNPDQSFPPYPPAP